MDSGLIERVRFTSSKIKGQGDVERLESELSGEDGVRQVNVDPENHTVTVDYDPTIIDENAVKLAVEDAGYRIDSEGVQLEVGSETVGS
ncbi:MAG TPA: heavy metal-associated domain-containing protein [Chloroflexota bacterium]